MDSNNNNTKEFALRALIWGGCAALFGFRGDALAGLALGGPILEQVTDRKIEDVIENLLKDAFEKQNQQYPANPPLEVPQIKNPFIDRTKEKNVSKPESMQSSEIVKDNKWLEVIPHPSVVLTIGGRGKGKSALNHRLLQLFRFRSQCFVLGMPQQALKYLPEWLGVVSNLDEVPDGSTVVVDEAHLQYNARDSHKQMNREISRIIALSRQKRLTLLIISQQARTIDINIASSADVLIIKEPEPLEVKFERSEITELIKTAVEKFQSITKNRAKWSLVYSPASGFFDMLTNELPSYWSDQLSRIYASSGPSAAQKPARKMNKAETSRMVKELRRMGQNVSQTMRTMGFRSRTTVYKYLNMPDVSV